MRDTAIAEQGITSAAVGAAIGGMRPVLEIMFNDFMALALDQLANEAAKLHYMTGGQLKVPLTVRTAYGPASSNRPSLADLCTRGSATCRASR